MLCDVTVGDDKYGSVGLVVGIVRGSLYFCLLCIEGEAVDAAIPNILDPFRRKAGQNFPRYLQDRKSRRRRQILRVGSHDFEHTPPFLGLVRGWYVETISVISPISFGDEDLKEGTQLFRSAPPSIECSNYRQ